MIKKTPPLIMSMSFFLLLLTCSGMEERKAHILAENGIWEPLDEISNDDDISEIKVFKNVPDKQKEEELKPKGKESPLSFKEYVLLILQEIDNNNAHVLKNGYQLNNTENLIKFADLHRQRKDELKSKFFGPCDEECNPLTVPALIMVNEYMHKELLKHFPAKHIRVTTHEALLETLESLKE